MPSWVTVVKNDMEMYVVAALIQGLNEAALGDTQSDRFTEVKNAVIAQVRMAVASCDTNVLDADETLIPLSLRPDACWIIAGYLATGLKYELTEQQANEVSVAREKLLAVARCDITVEGPDTIDPTPDAQSGSAVEMIPPQTKQYTRDTMAGL